MKLIYYYGVLALGLFCVSWILWSRFFRERILRDIPDDQFTEYRFWILLYICFIYLFTIKNLLKHRETHPFIQEIVNFSYYALFVLDRFIKHNKYTYDSYYNWFKHRLKLKLFSSIKEQHTTYIIFLMQIFPRIMLVSFILVDTFYFARLELFYKIVLVRALPLIIRYIKYSFKDIYNHWIELLEERYQKIFVYEEGYKLEALKKPSTTMWEIYLKVSRQEQIVLIITLKRYQYVNMLN